MTRSARAVWFTGPGKSEIRLTGVPDPGPDDVLVRTLFSGVSRGTEALVLHGGVPENQHAVMRAPFQEGDFPWPVKYGYLNVGVVEQGPSHLRGRPVFCLYPHQTHYVVPASAVTPVPQTVPPERAVLAGTVETAVNALWDARPLVGDRVAVVGGGMVGCAVAALLARFPGVDLQLIDTDEERASTAAALDVDFATPADARRDLDLVVHASASEAGLDTALNLLAREGTVVELSWYGSRRVAVPLGEHFHSRRLTVRASQVGTVARPDRTFAERMALALDLLADDRFDALISGESGFAELPDVLTRLPALCHRVRYGADA
ncbi:zinc-dependent alcohol dehydrogenase [Saccharothrix variisporea]|uniref:2-desacetyl-2-hydroxyethyl bacteriochlorophyllide A dehydrogenase n=1 Tax=Saccharothrix variisporea TaxID=543527 RepID=A0A495X3N4_9PSEU|nr:zinc-binding alcohol dehydrogenase [Saccharothrix variisporea]RKT68119.1 2-desacetyl-2-hydroxyethyl bacteriochlorophyllide A dehydrogenase [Saccharothrix variisporea]